MTAKTSTQVQAEISKLKELAPKVRQHDAFGGNNRNKIELQIEVLENAWGQDDVEERYGGDFTEEELDENCAELYNEAMDAVRWREGTGDIESLAKEWETLLPK